MCEEPEGETLFVFWVTSLLANILGRMCFPRVWYLDLHHTKYSQVPGFKQITFDYVIEKWKDENFFTNQILISITKDLHNLFVEELFDNLREY